MNAELRAGFVIERFLDLHLWKPMTFDRGLPLTAVPQCPADGTALRTLCTFTEVFGETRVRLGCCPRCGHVTYIDRPNREWMDTYYLDTWDSHEEDERADQRSAKRLKKEPKEKTVVKLTKGLPVERSRPVCEIGSGWGDGLYHLSAAGFTHLVGTEASCHRADMVRDTLRVSVYTAAFESAATQQALAPHAPFSVILSNHVLEHTYAPDDVFRAAAALQDPGDYLVVAVPNQEKEPPMSVLMFLPHLHAFTRTSLESLAAVHQYAIVNDQFVKAKQLVFVFQKHQGAVALPPPVVDVFTSTVRKFTTELRLDRRHFGTRRFWWLQRRGDVDQRFMWGQGAFEARRWENYERQHDLPQTRQFVVSSLERRHTTSEESPIEIQFRDSVALFYK